MTDAGNTMKLAFLMNRIRHFIDSHDNSAV